MLELVLAEEALLAGRLASAELHLGRVSGQGPRGDHQIAAIALQVRAELALARGQHRRALRHFRELSAHLAHQGGAWPDAEIGQARALAALGRDSEAIAVLQQADTRVSEQQRELVLSHADTFAEEHTHATQLWAELLVRNHRLDEAFALLRRVRVRHLLPLMHQSDSAASEPTASDSLVSLRYAQVRERLLVHERNAWRLDPGQLERARVEYAREVESLEAQLVQALKQAPPAPELADQGAQMLQLAFFPAHGGKVHAFARLGETLQYALIPQVASDTPSTSRWLAPFVALIAQARRVQFIGAELAQLRAAHTLSYLGRPLFDAVAVEFSLDLPGTTSSPVVDSGETLLVLDPRLDLPGARREADTLRSHLGEGTTWLQGQAASRDAVYRGIERAGRFHYAGHIDATAGPFLGGLKLADDADLTVTDLLMAARVPRSVALLGCDSARPGETSLPALNLANAFLLKGAREVIAVDRAVPDTDAGQLSAHLYRAVGDSATRLRAAQRALAEGGVDVSPYRVLTP
jgi:tetratricopeptide (TPR) repeat protein